jgi:YD repeat-containing protein
LPGVGETGFLIPSEDGTELYAFDLNGRHLRTLDALTGAVLFDFVYDDNGWLTQIVKTTGGTDNISTIHRDGLGTPTSFQSPYGQVTTFAADAEGYLTKVVNPAGEFHQMILHQRRTPQLF